jgi:hypothetical protein
MYIENMTVVLLIVIALFTIPLVIMAFKQKVTKPFFFLHHLTKVFNKAFIMQLAIGILLVLSSYIIENSESYKTVHNPFLDTVTDIAGLYLYIAILYLFALGILNLINWVVRRVNP